MTISPSDLARARQALQAFPEIGDSWLAAEHNTALDKVRQRHLDWLVAHGVTGWAFLEAGMLGVDRVAFDRELYEPRPDGEPAFVHPVVEFNEVVDLIA